MEHSRVLICSFPLAISVLIWVLVALSFEGNCWCASVPLRISAHTQAQPPCLIQTWSFCSTRGNIFSLEDAAKISFESFPPLLLAWPDPSSSGCCFVFVFTLSCFICIQTHSHTNMLTHTLGTVLACDSALTQKVWRFRRDWFRPKKVPTGRLPGQRTDSDAIP